MITDVELQDRVVNELGRERLVDVTALRVDVHDGYVTLAGQVDSPESRAAAEWAAGRVEGVKGVASEIVVLVPTPDIIQ